MPLPAKHLSPTSPPRPPALPPHCSGLLWHTWRRAQTATSAEADPPASSSSACAAVPDAQIRRHLRLFLLPYHTTTASLSSPRRYCCPLNPSPPPPLSPPLSVLLTLLPMCSQRRHDGRVGPKEPGSGGGIVSEDGSGGDGFVEEGSNDCDPLEGPCVEMKPTIYV